MQNTTGTEYFASAGDGVKIWDASTLEVVKQYDVHKDVVKDLTWSRDGTFLCSASSCGDKIVLCECLPQGKEKPKVLAEHAAGDHQTCVRVSTNGRKLYSGGVDGAICVWDRETGRMRKSFKGTHTHPITCIALNDSETHVASGSNKGDVVIRNLSNELVTKPLDGAMPSAIRSMTFSPWKHSLLGMCTDDGSINLWDSLQGCAYHEFTNDHNAPAMSLMFSPFNELLLASVGLDKTLRVYDVKGRKFLSKVTADQPLLSLTFLNDGYSLFTGSSLGKIIHFDLRFFNKPVKEVSAHTSSVYRLTVRNLIKSKKHSRSSRSDGQDRKGAGDASSKVKENPQTKVYGKGDYPHSISSSATSSSSSMDSAARANKKANIMTNGHRTNGKEQGTQSSTPTTRVRQTLPSNVDDLGGAISPVREEVFGNFSLTSADSNQPDGTYNEATISLSSDTIGSYTDDILSPLAGNTRYSKGKVPVGVQIHSKTSPHPLRQSYNASPASTLPGNTDNATVDSSLFRNRKGATSTNTRNNTTKADSLKPPTTQNLVNLQPAPVSGDMVNSTSDLQTKPQEKSQLQSTVTKQSADSAPSTSSCYNQSRDHEMAAFRYQAEYLRNTVKEIVDEMSDDLRAQISDVMSLMVKLSLHQEELMQQMLSEKRCTVNEELLRECERLREENDRLQRKF